MLSDFRFLTIARSNGVATVHLDKPPVNALDEQLYGELLRACDELDGDAETRAVVFASRHPKIFIAGADIKGMKDYPRTAEWVDALIARVHVMFNRLEDIAKPTVAAITGHALGGGCEFALAMDFRFMARGKPRIGLPEVNIGIIPGGGGIHRAPRVLGYARAAELMMTGRHLDADEAERIGLIHRACEPESTLADAQAFALQLAGQAPLAVRLIKQALKKAWGMGREPALALEREHCHQAVLSEDAIEGVVAFIEKRKPRWKGK